MQDQRKTKTQLIGELEELRRRVVELEGRLAHLEHIQAALGEAEAKYRTIAENTYDWEFWTDSQGQFVYTSPSCERITGHTAREFQADPDLLYRIIHPSNLAHYHEHADEVATTHMAGQVTFRVIRADGTERWVEHFCQPVFEGEQFLGTRGSNRDISERKLVEETLRDSEARNRLLLAQAQRQAQELTLLDQVRTAVAREMDLSALFRTVVQAVADAFGYSQMSVYMLHGDTLVIQHQLGHENVVEQIPSAQGLCGRVVRTGQPILLQDVRTDPDFMGDRAGIVSEICIPLFDQQQVCGIFNVESKADVMLDKDDLRLLTALGEQISIAIERARLYTEARASAAKFRSIVEQSADGITLTDEQGLVIEWNPAQEQITGLPPNEVVGQPIWDILVRMLPARFALRTPTVSAQFQALTQQVLRTGHAQWLGQLLENQIERPDGTRRDVQSVVFPIKTNLGFMTASFYRDVTERKQAEQALRSAETRFRGLVEQSLTGIGIVQDDKFVYVNPRLAEMFGYTPDEMNSLAVLELAAPEDRPRAARRLRERLGGTATGNTVTFRGLCKDGTHIDVEASGQVVTFGEQSAVMVTLLDVTERRRTEEALRDSEALYHTLVEAMPVCLFRKDAEGRYTFANELYCQFSGKALDQIIGSTDFDLYPSELAQEYQSGDRHVMATGQNLEAVEEQPGPDGSTTYVQVIKTPVRDAASHIIGIQGIFLNVTDRRQAENKLQQSIEELATIHAISQAAAAQLELTTLLELVGDQLCQTFPAQVASVALHDKATGLIHFPYWRFYDQRLQTESLKFGQGMTSAILQTRQPILINQDYERRSAELGVVRLLSRIVGRMPQAWLGVPILVGEEAIGVISVQNYEQVHAYSEAHVRLLATIAANVGIAIQNAQLYAASQQELAERKRAEAELRQSNLELQARNEELDAFAHTVAHDLKNPLSHIVGYAELLQDDYAARLDEDTRRCLRNIEQNARKMSNIIDELLLLAEVRKADVHRQPLDMAHIVGEAQQRLSGMIEDYRAAIIAPPAFAWPVAMGYAPWIEEVWVNYLSNAIKYGGRPPRIELGAEVQPDGAFRFWVRDNGPGLGPEARSHLFMPFARLDQVRAKGHGLGLSIVRRIVEKLGGQAGVESDGVPGLGSTFFFTLPAAAPRG